ncbi:hypothetical protein E8D34_18750 [Nocardioides sp. GY 10113]|uniref:hypothetical protein n=1 Tax=Nocardioides sp. GY 10113 TaxID=2569761 RepID=UPI0010A86E28|nr:hypothetical protein [Nocardioides sp. GY 10113]TIC80689.1 hypothetical protein E8D34_18750 [Nocardioides sp. GY 10113]
MKKSLAASAVLSTTLTAIALVGSAGSATAAEQACTADSTKRIQTIPAVTHTESQYAKTVEYPAVYETVVVKVEYRKTTNGNLYWRDTDWQPDANAGFEPTGNVLTEQHQVAAASQGTVYYNGQPGGTTDPALAAWVSYAPTGWPLVVDTRTVTDAAESYVCDFEKPVTTLLNPASPVRPGYVFELSSTDNDRVVKTVGNVYRDGALLKSFQAAGDTLGVPVSFADGAYTLRYNSLDAAGNVASTQNFTFVVDGTAPTVTDKGAAGAVAQSKSFKLYDANKIDKVVINGVTKDLTDNNWSDVNDIRPGRFGAVEGANTLVAYDVAGNATTVAFVLDTTGPTVTDKGVTGEAAASKSFKLYDARKVDKVVINGVTKDLTDSNWSDVNDIRPGRYGAVEGVNTLVAYDALGNATTVTFTLTSA